MKEMGMAQLPSINRDVQGLTNILMDIQKMIVLDEADEGANHASFESRRNKFRNAQF